MENEPYIGQPILGKFVTPKRGPSFRGLIYRVQTGPYKDFSLSFPEFLVFFNMKNALILVHFSLSKIQQNQHIFYGFTGDASKIC